MVENVDFNLQMYSIDGHADAILVGAPKIVI